MRWTMHHDHARKHLGGTVSPPLVKRRRLDSPRTPTQPQSQPSPAAIEAGKAQIDDHLTYFLALYAKCSRATSLPAQPTISLDALTKLYTHHAGSPSGHSFVIHQHDHPKVFTPVTTTDSIDLTHPRPVSTTTCACK